MKQVEKRETQHADTNELRPSAEVGAWVICMIP
jgi:hypothetical protein